MAALYLSLAALVVPVVIDYYALTNPFLEAYLDRLGRYAVSELTALFSFVFLVVTVISIKAGRKALRKIRGSDGNLKGKGRAWTGIILGCIGFLPYSFLFAISAPFSPFYVHFDGSRLAVNQASAVGSLRTIHTAAEVYSSTYQRGYPKHLLPLGPPRAGGPQNAQGAGLIDEKLASGAKSGYVFIYQVTAQDQNHRPSAYTVTATPIVGCGKVGNCYFMDETGIIRQETARVPDKNSPLLAG